MLIISIALADKHCYLVKATGVKTYMMYCPLAQHRYY